MVKYERKDASLFLNFHQRSTGYDILSNIISSLEDFPYTTGCEYVEINSPMFLGKFTTDGEKGVIKYPKTVNKGKTKYVITRSPYPSEGYAILCVVSSEGVVTCKLQNEIANPNCPNIMFAVHQSRVDYTPKSSKFMPYQLYRDYDIKTPFESLVRKYNEGSINLKDFMAARHDIVQTLVAKMYGLSLHLGTELDLNLYGITSSQTPDFFEVVGNDCLIGDITITNDPTIGQLDKQSKYSKLIIMLESRGYKVLTFFCSFNHFFKNFELVFSSMPINQLDYLVDYSPVLGELATMYEMLKGTYPVETSELLEKCYPIDKFKIGRNYQYISENLSHKPDEYFLENYFDKYIMDIYADNTLDMNDLPNTYANILKKNKEYEIGVKPSHYIPIPPDDAGFETVKGKNSEQQMLLNFFSRDVDDEVFQAFKESLANCFTKYSDSSYKMFFEGKWLDDQDSLKKEYHEIKPNHSFEEFLLHKGYNLPKAGEDKIPYPKMLHMGANISNRIQVFLDKSGQDYRKKHEIREHSVKTTTEPPIEYRNVDRFLKSLCNKTGKDWSEDIFDVTGDDHKFFKTIKDNYSKMAREDIRDLGETYCMKYLRYNSLLYEQLIHYSNLSMSKKRYALFNSGIPNIVGCMRCGYRGMAQQIGKPFFFMGFTKSSSFLTNNMFGKLFIVKVSDDLYFYRTRWFRLPTFRIEFFRDQYYSILSSTMCSLARVRNMKVNKEMIKGTFALRTVVGLCANQKFMERLADSRYAIMSAFATHTNFEDLLIDKFSAPFKSSVEGWLVHRLFTQLPKFREAVYSSNNIKINTPVLDYLDRRFQQSTGGRFNIKAIWSDRQLYSLQDLLDELFLYVHTPKEPSTAFHEEVNAIKTIRRFQEEFDKYTFEEKCGQHTNVKKWLREQHSVGFDKDFLYAASLHYKTVVGFDLTRIEKMINRENIGELTSTKSVIPDVKRKIKPIDRHHKRRIEEMYKIHGKLDKKTEEYIKKQEELVNDKVARSTAEVYHGRHKVHDEIITYVMNYREQTVLGNALLYYNQTDCKVLTDICIKAQYGAKREFYVMNMGAKLMARVVENFYKEIAKQSTTEMISVPGDRKLIHMQNMMDRTIKHALKHGNIVSYCNGDCTKWSASETLEAFHVLTEGICAGWDSEFKYVLQAIINKWSDKRIQVPLNIISKVYPMGKQTDYIMEALENNFELESTQNFLQGVFNYMSSVKADVCNRYTVHLWNKYFNKDLRFSVEYLVHSDDYVFAFSSPDLRMIEEFRSFHKICMKLCGITDSSKKTNVQPIFMEFISLLCFNGSMSYPTIKKTKEVASTLPCESFSGDSDMVCSRTGECVRVGVDYYSSWLFHKIHMLLLRRAYSLHKGGENYIENCQNLPVQAFGYSDMHPIFYFLCKGDPNNLRLFNFSSTGKVLVKKLYDLSGYSDSLKSIHGSFKEPTFIYNNYTTRIAEIRKSTGIEPNEAMKYWEDNYYYNFVKPRKLDDLERWLKCMYFKSSFVKAYNRDSRTTRMLRLSMFSKGKCVTYKSDEELQEFYTQLSQIKTNFDRNQFIASEMLTIKELIQAVFERPLTKADDSDIQIAILLGDSTSDMIYQWADRTSISLTEKINIFNTCATYSPFKATWLNVSQPVDQVILYGISHEAFIENFGDSANVTAVSTDFSRLSEALPGLFDLIKNPTTSYQDKMRSLQIAYNMYQNNLPKFQVCMSSKRHRQNTADFLTDSFRYSHDPVKIADVHSKMIQMEMNPFTLQRQTILGSSRTTSQIRLICNNLTIAYIYLITQRKVSESEASIILRETILNDFGMTITIGDFLKMYDYEKAKMEGLTFQELMMFAFLKKLLNNEVEPIDKLCRNKQVFNYTYLQPQTYNPETRKYEGDMLAHVNFERVSALIKFKKGFFKVECDTINSSKAEIAYLIGLKLSSKISDTEFLKSIIKPNLQKYSAIYTAYKNAFYLSVENNTVKYKYFSKGEQFLGVPCMYDPRLHIPRNFDLQSNYILSTNYNINKAFLFVDRRKLFTLPFKAAKYTRINMTTEYEDFCLYNDLMAFHVLGTQPKEEHDLIELCKFWSRKEDLVIERPAVTTKISELSVEGIELILTPDNFMQPELDEQDFQQDPLVTIIEDDEYMELLDDPIEGFIGEQSPFVPLIRNIELIDPATTVMPTASSLRELEDREDVIKRTIMTLLTIDQKFLCTPFEAACTVRTVQKMLSDRENTWLTPLAHLIGKWLEKTVKIAPEYEELDGYLIRVVDDDLVYYQKRRRAAGVCRRLGLKNDDTYFCPVDFSLFDAGDTVEYYARVSQYEFWDNVGCYDPMPFYTKRDDFKELLQQYCLESMTL